MTMTAADLARRVENARRVNARRKGAGEFVGGSYQEPALPEFYCARCDLEFRTAGGLSHHNELRHEER